MESRVQDAAVAALPADFIRDPYPYFAQKRGEGGVFHGTVVDYSKTPESLRPKNSFAAVSFDAVNKAFRDGQVFSSTYYDNTIGLFIGPSILAMEGKKHREHRNLVSAAFKSKALARWEPAIVRPICNALIDEFIDAGQADLVRNFTFEFPTRVIAQLLGLPAEDLPEFRRRAVQLINYTIKYERAFEASAALKDYFLDHIEQRKAKPTDDIIGDLVTAEIDGEKLSDEAIYSFLRLLLPAGLETTYRSSGNLLYLLLTHPEQLAMVQQDRSLIPAAIEEGLRYETPLVMVMRTTTEEVEVSGQTIPANAQVDLCMGSANRDESRWKDANVFDIRRPRQGHISFAGGIHMCLGMHLARMETRVMLNSLLDRAPDLALIADDGTGEECKIVGPIFRSPNKLPVTFTPVS